MERLEKFTPIHPKKAAFYKSLLTFYKSVKESVSVENFTDKQMEYRLPLENFNVNGGYIPTCNIDQVSVLDRDLVKSMRPTMKVKIAIYNLLVSFFDATLSAEKSNEEINHPTLDESENFIAIAKRAMPDFIGISIISPKVLEEYKENKPKMMKNGKKKTFHVNVHFDAVVTVEVEAFSEEEARRVAEETAEFDNYEILGVTSCITDIIN